ncbi:hypothetical protein FGB62_128g030 [Gracilaria domingensis]|nr:hypothetical protein FGB62_128g030 [Gracilaria domingensis]
MQTKSYTGISRDMRTLTNLAYGEQDQSSINRIEFIQKASCQIGYAFKDGKTFGGTVKESWETAVRDFEQIVLSTYMPTENDALYLLPHMLKDNAKVHFDKIVKPTANDYVHAKKLMSDKFHNTAQQQRILPFLRNI